MSNRMCYVHASWVAVLVLSFTPMAAAQDPSNLLRRVAENYHTVRSFEIAGRLTTTIPGTELRIQIETVDAEAGRSFVPTGSTIMKYGEGQRFGAFKVSDSEGKDASKNGNIPNVVMPGHWGRYEQINEGVKNVKELPSEMLEVDGVPAQCDVLEVSYKKEGWSPDELTVKYWVDPNRLLVLKEQFSEQQPDDPAVWHWVYTVDSIELNQPPADWLVKRGAQYGDRARPEFVGRSAPDFGLPDLDGHQVKLSSLVGKVVVLDFWATWCGPCTKELPTVEKIANKYKASGVQVWSLAELWNDDETVSTVKEWMSRNPRRLQVLIDAGGKTFQRYEGESIPSILVIDRSGKILSYYTGLQSEQSLRSAIDMALNQSPARSK